MDVPYDDPPHPRVPPPSANTGDFNGGQNANVSFNPDGGQDSQGTYNFTSGGDSNPSNALANVSPNTPVNAGNTEYQTWNWEQIMDTMLGLSLPDRDLITSGRWTGIETNSSIDPGLFLILSIEWYGSNYKLNKVNVYLSPEFTAESTSTSSESPWLVYQQGPGLLLGPQGGGTTTLTSGVYGLDVPGNSELQLDPSKFAPAVQALMDAEDFYMNAMDTLGFIAQDLAGDANQFQGEAGGEFAQLMQDFSQQAVYAQGQMGLSVDLTSSYSGLVLQAGEAAGNFLMGIWNAWAGWTWLLTHTPLGAILQALIQSNIVSGPSGDWTISKNVNLENVSGVGDLRTDAAWQVIENNAKDIWTQTLVSNLDAKAEQLLVALANSYYNATNNLAPLKAPTPTQIGSDINGGGANVAGINFPSINFSGLFPNNMFSGLFPNNMFSDMFPNNMFSDMFPNNMFSDMFPNNMFSDMFPNNMFSDIFPNNMFSGSSVPNGSVASVYTPNGSVASLYTPNGSVGSLYTPNGSVGSLYYSPNTLLESSGPGPNPSGYVTPPASALVVGPNQPTVTATVGPGASGANSLGPLQEALDSNAGTQDALQAALTSGQVPPGSALQGDLNTALNDANQTQTALDQAAGAGNTTNSALQSALADNAGTQAALNQALDSGQVTPGSPLSSTLTSALTGANQTQAALNQAVAAGPPPSAAQTSALRTALGDNSQTQQELSQALVSGQVPASSPLHSTIQSALTDAGKTQAAINQALKSGTGTTTASLDQALKDNQATQSALNAALASGQVPTSGPLRNDLNQALADSKETGAALQQALAQQGVQSEPSIGALTSAVGVPGIASAGTGLGAAPLLSASLPATGTTAQAGPVSSGAFAAPGTQTTAAAEESPFPMYSPMAGSGMMGGQGGQGQGQERERSTWLAEDDDVWGTDPEVGPQVLGRGYTDDEEPEEYDGYTERPNRPTRNRPPRRLPGR
jgi:hypothetical protein